MSNTKQFECYQFIRLIIRRFKGKCWLDACKKAKAIFILTIGSYPYCLRPNLEFHFKPIPLSNLPPRQDFNEKTVDPNGDQRMDNISSTR